MQNTIFTVELPFVGTEEELEKIKTMYPKCDPYFIASGCIKERRKKFDTLWKRYKPYADSHFLPQIKINFHQRSWEMYIGNVLLEKGLIITPKKDEGPDFIVGENLYVECIAPTKGDPTKSDSVPKMFVATKPEEIRAQDVPSDKMVLRITQAIKDKALDQYKKWEGKTWFKAKVPFVVAINTGGLEHAEDPNIPNVLKALFELQFRCVNTKTGKESYSYRNAVLKSNKTPVSVNYFANQDFSFVSGVLFSNKVVLNYPNQLGDDCIFVNNPFADNPVSVSFVKLFKNWAASQDTERTHLKRNYN